MTAASSAEGTSSMYDSPAVSALTLASSMSKPTTSWPATAAGVRGSRAEARHEVEPGGGTAHAVFTAISDLASPATRSDLIAEPGK